MKIRSIKATPVNITLEIPYYWVQGALPGFTQTIVEVVADNGIVGLGEAPTATSADIITKQFLPRLEGRDALDIAGCERVCLPSWRGVQSGNDYPLIRAFGGVEMALWDLRGKLWEQPLYKLLGGAVRKEIPFTDYFAFRPRVGDKGGENTPEAVADYCLGLKEKYGSTYFEGKFSTHDPRQSLNMIRRLRQVLGEEAMIRIDSNKAYSVSTALRLIPSLEELRVSNWEDPVGTFEEMARLRPHSSIPFSTHIIDLPRALELGTPDAFVTDVSIHGGIGRMVRFVAACEATGLDFWPYSGDSGVGIAAYLHLAAATQWIREPGQSMLHMQNADVIEGGPFELRRNVVAVPEGPGLGVKLSPEGLEHCHRLFLENGPLNKFYDENAPGVYRRLPLA
jgi:glucarate dehydratase